MTSEGYMETCRLLIEIEAAGLAGKELTALLSQAAGRPVKRDEKVVDVLAEIERRRESNAP